MNGSLNQLYISIRLQFRNKMGLLYGYLFPTIFLVAFWVLYRHEIPPLMRHMGELLTVTALGGACFGLPTTLVSERERGVWRRYRLAPIPTGYLVASTVASRYLILLTAAVLQLVLAMIIGMPLPLHLFDLWIAFTFVSFAFLGLGLVIAMLADNVPAVQALGQCIFLPMLIIGGVAVRLASLPPWAQHLSAFFPGRYAVDAIQATVTGDGLGAARFSLLALLLIGAAGCLAGSKMFRWDAQQRFSTRAGKGWVAVALAAWLAVGLLAESGGLIASTGSQNQSAGLFAMMRADTSDTAASPSGVTGSVPDSLAIASDTVAAPVETAADSLQATSDSAAASSSPVPTRPRLTAAESAAVNSPRPPPSTAAPPTETVPRAPAPATPPPASTAAPFDQTGPWQAVTLDEINQHALFDQLPADNGVVAPIASANEEPEQSVADLVQCIQTMLPEWAPGKVRDPVQRVRNFLYVAAVPDMFQLDLERWAPQVVFDRLEQDIPRGQLIKLLYWVARNPSSDDETATDQLRAVCIDVSGPSDLQTLHERVSIYALKLLGRLTGNITPG